MTKRGKVVRPSSELASRRFRNTPSRDTPAELAIRRLLHAKGYRYRVDTRPLEGLNRRADLVFRRQQVAVFVDGCYWHGCPHHYRPSKSNAEWWSTKIAGNRARDADTTATLEAAGWRVLRFWEHENPDVAADEVAEVLATEC